MLNISGANKCSIEIGEFLYPQGSSQLRALTFPLAEAIISVSLLDGITLQQLESLAGNFPREFSEFTQSIRHDLWSAMKHLSVQFEDVWIRLLRGQDLKSGTFRRHACINQVALVAVIHVGGRLDRAAVATCFQSVSCSLDALRSASFKFAKLFLRHTTARIVLRTGTVISGTDLPPADHLFFSTMLYVSSASIVDVQLQELSLVNAGSTDVFITISMDDVKDFLHPPVLRQRVVRYEATRPTSPVALRRGPGTVHEVAWQESPRREQRLSPTKRNSYRPSSPLGTRTVVEPARHAGSANFGSIPSDRVLVTRKREPAWSSTSYHNTATSAFAPQAAVCYPSSAQLPNSRPSIRTTPLPARGGLFDDSVDSDVDTSNITHVVARGNSTPVRHWAQRGASVPFAASPSIRL